MRDGHGTKLTDDEAAKLKDAVKPKQDDSLSQVSVDPEAADKPKSDGDDDRNGKTRDSTPTI